MGSCAAPSAKGDDKFITTDYLQQCQKIDIRINDNSMDQIFVRKGKDQYFSRSELLPRRKIFMGMPHMEAELVGDIVDIQKCNRITTFESSGLDKCIEDKQSEGEALLVALRKKGRGRYKNIRENRKKEVLYKQEGGETKKDDDYLLPLANNIVILPGPEDRKKWIAKQNDIREKDKPT